MAQLSLIGMLFFLSSLKKEIIMNQIFYDAIMENPVIAAVKDEDGVLNCMQKDINVVFVLFGELTTISDIVDRLKSAGKIVIVHLDLIGGLAVREESVRFIKQYTKADGIISTKPDMIKSRLYKETLDLCVFPCIAPCEVVVKDSLTTTILSSSPSRKILFI